MDQLHLVRPQGGHGIAHLGGEAQVLDHREDLSREHGGDDRQARDHDEQADVMGLGVFDRRRRDRQGEEEVGECDLPDRLALALLARVGGPLRPPHGSQGDEEEPGHAACVDQGGVMERGHVGEVGQGAVGDDEADQAGDEEHEPGAPAALPLGEDPDADGGDDHVADGVGETDSLGEHASRA